MPSDDERQQTHAGRGDRGPSEDRRHADPVVDDRAHPERGKAVSDLIERMTPPATASTIVGRAAWPRLSVSGGKQQPTSTAWRAPQHQRYSTRTSPSPLRAVMCFGDDGSVRTDTVWLPFPVWLLT